MSRDNLVVTTSSSLDGWDVQQHLDIVSAHVVAGTNVFSDVAGIFRDFVGGRSSSYQKQLASINAEAIALLKEQAARLGANAIVGLSIDHDEVSGGSKSMFMVTAIGTAVRAKQIVQDPDAVQVSPSLLSAERMAAKTRRHRIINASQNVPTSFRTDTWDFILREAVHEVAPTILSIVRAQEKDAQFGDSKAKEQIAGSGELTHF